MRIVIMNIGPLFSDFNSTSSLLQILCHYTILEITKQIRLFLPTYTILWGLDKNSGNTTT